MLALPHMATLSNLNILAHRLSPVSPTISRNLASSTATSQTTPESPSQDLRSVAAWQQEAVAAERILLISLGHRPTV